MSFPTIQPYAMPQAPVAVPGVPAAAALTNPYAAVAPYPDAVPGMVNPALGINPALAVNPYAGAMNPAALGAVPYGQLPGAQPQLARPSTDQVLNFITSGTPQMQPVGASNDLNFAAAPIPGQTPEKVAEFFAGTEVGAGPGGLAALAKAAEAEKADGDGDAAAGDSGDTGDAGGTDDSADAAAGSDDSKKSDSESDTGSSDKPESDAAPATPEMLAKLAKAIAEKESNSIGYKGGSKIQAETKKLDAGVPDNLPD